MKTLKEFKLKNKRVLVRCDFNVPLDQRRGIILDDFRIKETIPTIEYLTKKGAKIILMTHLGRPEGRVVESLRLTPIQDRLMEYLDLSVTKTQDCIGKEVEDWTNEMQSGEILLLENLRFHKEEEENDENFAKELSRLGDIYINDAFGASHRAHASIVGVPKYLPSGAGFLLEKEINILTDLIKRPKEPLVAIIGGAKAEEKVRLINNFSEIADFVLIGGLIKREIKDYNPPTTSEVPSRRVVGGSESRSRSERASKNIQLKHPKKIVEPIDEIEGKDIGPETVNIFKKKISQAKTIFWNGPLGKIEEKRFLKGTEEIAKAIIKSGAFSVVGGGETVEFINKIGLVDKFNHISTGGGAMLEFLSGEKLPGIESLK